MINKTTPLQFLDFQIIGFNFFAVPSDSKQLANNYPIDVDLDILYDGTKNFLLRVELASNEKMKPGYSYSIYCQGKFSFKPGTSEDEIDRQLLGSALRTVIHCIRNHIMEISSRSIYGQYIMPFISNKKVIARYRNKLAKAKSDKK